VGSYFPGGTLNYVVVVTNHGPADAVGMSVSAARPAQLGSWTWACAVSTPAGYNCTSDNSNPATFTDTLDLPQLASVTYNVTAQVVAAPAGSLTTTVVAFPPAGMSDLTNADNVATDIDTLATTTLSIAKSAAPDPVRTGSVLTYTLQVSNTGAVNAGGLVVSDPLPVGVGYLSASGTGWSCGVSVSIVTCTRDLLAPGAAPPIVIEVLVSSESTLINTVTASAVNAPEAAAATTQTQVTVPVVPTLDRWALVLVALLLVAGAGARLRRR